MSVKIKVNGVKGIQIKQPDGTRRIIDVFIGASMDSPEILEAAQELIDREKSKHNLEAIPPMEWGFKTSMLLDGLAIAEDHPDEVPPHVRVMVSFRA